MTSSQRPEGEATAQSAVEGSVKVRRRGLGPIFFVVLAVAVVLSGTLAYDAIRNRVSPQGLQSLRVSGIPASVPTSTANLMALSPVPHSLAPNFTLVDQHGKSMSLNSFKGRTVVLEFMDPHCVDICPIVSQEFVDAYHDLGAQVSSVVFVAVNVNQYFTSVADMAKFSKEHGLNTIPSWHFFTGPVNELKAIWHAYGIVVEAPKPTSDIIHTSIVYFIGPNGRKRYVGVPMDDHTAKGTSYLPANQLASWGSGIALVAQSLSH
jgi:cytochrome oxidase Cu insertion factor (SCO1/SenC/PrrC family)